MVRSAVVRSRLRTLNWLSSHVVEPAGSAASGLGTSSPAARERRYFGWRRALGHGLVLSGLLMGLYIFLYMAPVHRSFGVDALAYWLVNVPGAYDIPHRSAGSFPYSPPAALIASTFSLVSLWTFLWLWTALLVASLVWIGSSFSWMLVAFAFPFVAVELYLGNIHILLAVAVLLGFRHPWTWAFVLLTKFSCGVGLLWFVVRGEWRSLGIALGTTALLCLISLVIAPYLWPEWIRYVLAAQSIDDRIWNNVIHVPLAIRMIPAVIVVVWGARTDREWTVLVAVTLALPVLWMHGFAVLVGLVAELRRRSASRVTSEPDLAATQP